MTESYDGYVCLAFYSKYSIAKQTSYIIPQDEKMIDDLQNVHFLYGFPKLMEVERMNFQSHIKWTVNNWWLIPL